MVTWSKQDQLFIDHGKIIGSYSCVRQVLWITLEIKMGFVAPYSQMNLLWNKHLYVRAHFLTPIFLYRKTYAKINVFA